MTILESYAIEQLEKFIDDAQEQGICFNGAEIDSGLQLLIINIIKSYIEGYAEGD